MSKISSKLILIYSAAAILITSVIRFFQYVSLIDYRTGFFFRDAQLGGNLIYVVLLVFALGFIGLTLYGRKKKWTALTVSSDGMNSKSTIFLGAAFIITAAIKIINTLNLVGADFFKIVSSYTFAICFGILGLILLKNTVPPFFIGFITLFSSLYYFVLAVEIFSDDLIIKNRSDNLILLLCYVLGTLFFTALARFFSRLETKNSRTREIIFGGFSFILSSVHVLSKLIAYIFGGDAIFGMSDISLDAVILMILSGTFLFVIAFTDSSKEIEYLVSEKKKEKKTEE